MHPPAATDAILQGYAAMAAAGLARGFEAVVPETLYAPVIDLLPQAPARIADIGAGTGRDAAWLATQGHAVLAVEPVAELRQIGLTLHPSAGITWRDDRLPALAKVTERFDHILVTAVWQHLAPTQRGVAMRRLAQLLLPQGQLILSLRHGPGAPDRPVFDLSPEETIADATAAGLTLVRQCEAESVQPANRNAAVRWTWLAFRAVG